MRILVVLGLSMLTSSPLWAEVEVRSAGGRISLRAVSAPVSEVLESLARQTGMRVIYDAPAPRQALTTTLEDRAPAEVVLSVLEGLGLNYALVMDSSGARVDQLLLLGTLAATATSTPTPPSPTPVSVKYRPPVEQEQPEALEDEEDVDPPHETLTPEEQETFNRLTGKTAPGAPSAGPRPPEYPSSSFSPRLPVPTPPPSAQPTPPQPDSQ